MKSQQLLRVDEFCQIGNLVGYRQELTKIFEEIENSGCLISARYDRSVSQHEYAVDGSCRIRISLQGRYDTPLQIVWCILHEYGHHLSGKPSSAPVDPKELVLREKIAWDHAEDQLEKYPQLLSQKQSFIQYKDICLNVYHLYQQDNDKRMQ